MHEERKTNVCHTFFYRSLGNQKTLRDNWEYEVLLNESILSVRLPRETFRGLFDVLKVIRYEVPTEEFNKALVS